MTHIGPTQVHHGRVEWMDTDAAGIAHNTAISRFVESAEASLMGMLGLHDYFARAPRVRYEVQFERPLYFGQGVTTLLRIDQIGRSSMTFGFEIWGQEFDGRPRARAAFGSYVTVHAVGTHSAGDVHAEPWPADWVKALSERAPARTSLPDTEECRT